MIFPRTSHWILRFSERRPCGPQTPSPPRSGSMSRAASVVWDDGHAFGKRYQKTNGKDPAFLMGKRKTISIGPFSIALLDGCLICRHRSSVLVLLPSTVSFSPLCGLRLLPASHPPWPPRGLPQYRSVKIVSFSDPILFLVSPTCVQLWVPVLWQVFFPFKEGFSCLLECLVSTVTIFSIAFCMFTRG